MTGLINFPVSLRQQISVALRSSDVEKMYGKPNIARDGTPYSYEIRKKPDNSQLIVIYNSQSKMVTEIWQLNTLLKKEAFSKLVIKTANVDDVKKIDPFTHLVETSENKAVSEHQLIDGRATINYVKENQQWVIASIEFTIPGRRADLSSILKPEDLKEILP
ncbi:hypothetical protein J2Z22_003695 [Paenibacillus forsythiae]|uniref:DUF4367 domain-containing protein n=1 Tax=Paenibacillus forsythiae TaxID=365616 RepID=A0ABU3HBJ6_9BACL|nr:hypothetical protein [Paenibacillus forsythiae]MDT3428105.1 hypothetical protein [Paenibacillus forsythiae]